MPAPTLAEAIAALIAAPQAEVIAALKKDATPLVNVINQEGFNNGYGKKQGEFDTLKVAADKSAADLVTMTAERDKLARGLPADVAAVRTEHQQEVTRLTEQHKAELKARDEAIVAERTSNVVTSLRTRLQAPKDSKGQPRRAVREVYATVATQDKAVRDRIKPLPDGTFQVLQAGKQIPVAAATTEEALDVLAEELAAGAPSDMVVANTDAGGGVLPGGPVQPDAGEYAKIREEVKTQAAKTGDVKPHGAFSRLGGPET